MLRRYDEPRDEEFAQRGVTPTRRDAEDEDRGKQKEILDEEIARAALREHVIC